MNSAHTVADYWNRFVGSHLNSPDHWEANQVVLQSQWRYVTGDPFKNPLDWFMETYGPFRDMASICCGSGVLEVTIASHWLPKTNGTITGYDISPGSIEAARQRCAGFDGAVFKVFDVNVDTLEEDQFDAVFAHGALHHVEKLDHCLGQLRNALKPSGLLYVNDYVGPRQFQWTDVQFRLAKEFLQLVPERFRRSNAVVRCDPVALREMDPSEAVRSDHIMDHITAHFEIVVRSERGGTLLAPIFGSGCIDPAIFETPGGMSIIESLCEKERALIDSGALRSDNVIVVAKPRR